MEANFQSLKPVNGAQSTCFSRPFRNWKKNSVSEEACCEKKKQMHLCDVQLSSSEKEFPQPHALKHMHVW